MAHGKIRYIKPGSHGTGERLAKALAYSANREKTEDGLWVSALNCSLEGEESKAMNVYRQMMETKQNWGSTDGRQGYDLIVSFRKEEKDKAKCWEILQNITQEMFGDRFETMICMHTNTDYLHGHITINSVSFVDGKKFRYEPGEWKRRFQPVIDQYAQQAGYAADRKEEKKSEPSAREGSGRSEEKIEDGKTVNWRKTNKEDMDEAVRQSGSYEEFEAVMRSMGYYMDYGKQAGMTCLKIRKASCGQMKYRRCTEKTLGYAYTLEGIRERIAAKGRRYPQIAAEHVPAVTGIHYHPHMKKRVFRRWEELSPVEQLQLGMYFRFQKKVRSGYRINWKVVGKYKRLAKESLQKRNLLLKYGIDAYSRLKEGGGYIEEKKQACNEKLEEIRRQESVFLQELRLYRRIETLFAEGKKNEAEEVSGKLLKEYGHSVEETRRFAEQLSIQKKQLRKEMAVYKKEQRQLDEIRKEYEQERIRRDSGEPIRKPQKRTIQKI